MKSEETDLLLLFNEEERKAMWANVDQWLSDPTKLELWLERNALFAIQAAAAFATGEKYVEGKAGASVMARAMREFIVLAQRVLGVLRAEEKGDGKDQAGG